MMFLLLKVTYTRVNYNIWTIYFTYIMYTMGDKLNIMCMTEKLLYLQNVYDGIIILPNTTLLNRT